MTKFEKWLEEKKYDPKYDVVIVGGSIAGVQTGEFKKIVVPSMKGFAILTTGKYGYGFWT